MEYDRHIAIGDVHGCVHALDALLEAVRPTSRDLFICLGDVIDYGRDSRATISTLIELTQQSHLVLIRGNHEEMLLAALEDPQIEQTWLNCGGVSTVNSYRFCGGIHDIDPEHIAFLRQSVDYFETETHLFVHANYCPQTPMDETPAYTLRWSLCDSDSSPWHFTGKPVIVGHTEQHQGEILDRESLICIDTYCRGYGWLTALDVKSGAVWQASRWGVLREQGESVEHLRQVADSLNIEQQS